MLTATKGESEMAGDPGKTLFRVEPHVSYFITMLLALVMAFAASPALNLGGTRAIPAMLVCGLSSIGVTLFMLVRHDVPVARGLMTCYLALVVSASFSLIGGGLSGATPSLPKFLVLNYQYLFMLVAYVLAAHVDFERLLLWVTAWGAAFGLLVFLQSAGVVPGANAEPIMGSAFRRGQLFFDQPNGTAAYLAIMLPLTFAIKTPHLGWKRLVWPIRGLLVLGLMSAFSRSAMAAIIVGGICAWFLRDGALVLSRRLLFALSFFLFCTLSLNAKVYELVELLTVGGSVLENDFSAVERLGLGSAGIQMFYAHPWFGVGIGNYPEVLGHYDSRLDSALGMPHNAVIHFACEQGFLGLVAFFIMVILGIFWSSGSDSKLSPILAWSFWTAVANSLFGWPFIHGIGELLMLIIGFMAFHARRTDL
ncbi:O-antigen ligase family protein [Stagnimonas aquatica]|uniref:O-antigen ligase family protein n=1 Tax=Stagnimonas aquatica TaxID=2689987 RepID=A0A3N0V8Q6_9GAMM|nr:O-antigen ligase family protein [Stagnimonas aquatica]ROH89153.1 O-antigen ligase family protein [Stagnimonas aquatica]